MTVTAGQLAAELQTTPSRLVRWLRAQRERGHPLLADRRPGVPYAFSREDADLLAAEHRANAALGHVSDSAIQRRAEAVIRDRLAERLGMPLAARTITLAAGAPVQVDAASPDGKVLAEIFARQGELKGGQQKKVSIDTLKLITIRCEHPDTRLVIAFADEKASRYATGGGWVAQALRTWNVDVEIIDIPQDLCDEILAAQQRQRMVNADDAADDVASDT
ncbi:MAG: hypothetical protein QOI48_4829 [Solirubrobacteraceae bacterium]|jgi:hypothetical protein|nr:hypothetical protein [Solirubrobacteraceae bacterium]